MAAPGFNVIGYVSGNLGMGVTARHFIRLLIAKGHPVAVLDIDVGLGRGGANKEYEHLMVPLASDLPHPINLFFLDIAALPDIFLTPDASLFRRDRLNVGLVWWELTVLPNLWIEALRLLDVILAGSDFVRHVFEFNIPGAIVVPCKHPLFFSDEIRGNRQRFGLPSNPVLFLSSFEPHSDPQRKNPFAAVRAFLKAFPTGDGAHLVIKMNNPDTNSAIRPRELISELKLLCSNDPRVHFVAESLPYHDVLSLYSSCDVFVSLHRSEGLGLAPLESMSLGKPVIATGWSGNLSYMDHTNACLVSYEFVPANGAVKAYTSEFIGKPAFWADPNVDEAAAWMRRLVDDPVLRERLGAKATEGYAKYQREAEEAAFLGNILAIFEQRDFIPGRVGEKAFNNQALMRAELEAELSPMRLLVWKARNILDRHLFWRFRRR